MKQITGTIELPTFTIKITQKEMEEIRLRNRSWFRKLLDRVFHNPIC